MDDEAIDQLCQLEPDQAAAALVRLLDDHPDKRSDLLRPIREKAPAIYAAWLLRTAAH